MSTAKIFFSFLETVVRNNWAARRRHRLFFYLVLVGVNNWAKQVTVSIHGYPKFSPTMVPSQHCTMLLFWTSDGFFYSCQG